MKISFFLMLAFLLLAFGAASARAGSDLDKELSKIGKDISKTANAVAEGTEKAAKELGQQAKSTGDSVAKSSFFDDLKSGTKKAWVDLTTAINKLFDGK